MRVRIIKSNDCPLCKTYIARLTSQNFEFETYDGDADVNQQELDKWGINDYPVVQILSDSGEVKHQFPRGTYSPLAIKHIINQLEKNKTR